MSIGTVGSLAVYQWFWEGGAQCLDRGQTSKKTEIATLVGFGDDVTVFGAAAAPFNRGVEYFVRGSWRTNRDTNRREKAIQQSVLLSEHMASLGSDVDVMGLFEWRWWGGARCVERGASRVKKTPFAKLVGLGDDVTVWGEDSERYEQGQQYFLRGGFETNSDGLRVRAIGEVVPMAQYLASIQPAAAAPPTPARGRRETVSA
jgi:hypothetical protein